MSRTEVNCKLMNSFIESLATCNGITGHSFSESLSESQQRTGEGSADLSLPRNTATKGCSQRQPLCLAEAVAGG